MLATVLKMMGGCYCVLLCGIEMRMGISDIRLVHKLYPIHYAVHKQKHVERGKVGGSRHIAYIYIYV